MGDWIRCASVRQAGRWCRWRATIPMVFALAIGCVGSNQPKLMEKVTSVPEARLALGTETLMVLGNGPYLAVPAQGGSTDGGPPPFALEVVSLGRDGAATDALLREDRGRTGERDYYLRTGPMAIELQPSGHAYTVKSRIFAAELWRGAPEEGGAAIAGNRQFLIQRLLTPPPGVGHTGAQGGKRFFIFGDSQGLYLMDPDQRLAANLKSVRIRSLSFTASEPVDVAAGTWIEADLTALAAAAPGAPGACRIYLPRTGRWASAGIEVLPRGPAGTGG